MKLKEEFAGRGIIDQISREDLWDLLEKEKIDFYMGHDPTFGSLQLGNLFAIITMRRLQQKGHRPWIVIGSATSMIGDPSGKNTERPLLSREEIVSNGEHIKKQLAKLLDFEGSNAAVVVDNYDWIGTQGFLEFSRDVGKHFRLGEMLAKESVRSRLNSKEGISYTEFSYQILQAYDFTWLYKNKGVRLQMGGSDQWGNITAGIDLTRKLYSGDVYALTFPLVTDHMGKKFGKSEKGAVFLDRKLTSPYQLFQYLLNVDDQKTGEYLKFFTELSLLEIETIIKEHKERPEQRQAQMRLAEEILKLVYGDDGLEEARQATKFFFGESLKPMKDTDVEHIFSHLPSVELPPLKEEGIDLLELLVATPLFNSKGEARRGIQQKGVYINNHPVSSEKMMVVRKNLISESCLIIRRGKKNYALVRFGMSPPAK